MTTPPNKIHFISDNTTAELVHHLGKVKGDEIFWFKYSKSITNNGKEFPMSLLQIKKLESMKLLTVE